MEGGSGRQRNMNAISPFVRIDALRSRVASACFTRHYSVSVIVTASSNTMDNRRTRLNPSAKSQRACNCSKKREQL